MWGWLKTLRKEGFHFRRQAPFHGYYLDFVCLNRKLVIELDGPSHGEEAQQRHDEIRDQVLQDNGFRVLRIQNRSMDEYMPGVVDTIYDALRDSPRAW
jgi:very-short-patch-repair endonuclease